MEPDGPVLRQDVNGLLLAETAGLAAGCEKLKPTGPDLAPVNSEKPGAGVAVLLLLVVSGGTVPAFVCDVVLPKGEPDMAVFWGLAGSGLALKMGLNRASLDGLNVKPDASKPLL